jgi:hypothetical protein
MSWEEGLQYIETSAWPVHAPDYAKTASGMIFHCPGNLE